MPLTAGQIIAIACEAAHSPGKTTQALSLLNAILSDACQERDYAEARGQFLFDFAPSQMFGGGNQPTPPSSGNVWGEMIWGSGFWGDIGGTTPAPIPSPLKSVWPGVQFGSGPYQMPVDFLRLSGSSGSSGSQRSFIWWLNGVPYAVLPMDLADFDMQVQQTGLESYVWLAATDMSAPLDDRVLLQTTGDTTAGSNQVLNLGSTARLIGGGFLGVAGQGIAPGTTLDGLGSPGQVLGSGNAIIGTGGGSPIGTGPGGGAGSCFLSQAATVSIVGASLIFGYAPTIFVWPPPVSALQAMIRYQRQMPPITDTTRFPWLHNDGYLIEKLTGRLCQLNDDTRADLLLGGPDMPGSPEQKLALFLSMKDDEQSHPKRVELDRRAFGRRFSGLGPAKRTGQIY